MAPDANLADHVANAERARINGMLLSDAMCLLSELAAALVVLGSGNQAAELLANRARGLARRIADV